jgi:beta-lactamase regulating signal transducer with metallopeptidase domain
MTVIAILYQVFTPLLSKRYSARTLYYSWIIIIIGFIIPFRPRFDFGLLSIPMDIRKAHFSPLLKFVTVLWVGGVIAVLVYQLLMHYRFIKAVNRWGEKLETEAILLLLQNEQKKTGVIKDVSVYKCEFISSPLLLGLRQPKILLPDIELSSDELSMIIRHELIHLRQKDILAKFIILLATALHWYNPIIWLSSKAISLQCEINCDNETMINTNAEQRQQYSETLIGVIRQAKLQTLFATNFSCSKQNLKNRIFSVMDMRIKTHSFAIIGIISVLMITTGIFIADTQIATTQNGVNYEFNNEDNFQFFNFN